ncbi:MAG: extracellular solute-binding protein [Chloroflexota bacterium]|nr:extracellular solute-binding protein [Chloroflexota bacterium]
MTLRISTQNGPSTDALKPLFPKFESKYGAKVEVLEDVYTQIQSKQFAEAKAHTGAFDLIGLQTFDLGKYVSGGVLADLQPLFDDSSLADPNYDLADFAPAFVNGYCKYDVGGKHGLYALPHKFDIYLAIYRPDLFDAAGLARPGDKFSYNDLLSAAEKLKSKQPDKPALSMPLKSPGPAFTTWSAIFRSNGGEYFDANKYPLFNNDQAISAAEQLKSMLKYLPQDVLSLDFDPAIRIMAQGNAAYAENWNSFYPAILDPKQSTVKDKVGFLMTPAGGARRAQELGGWTLGLSPDSKNKKAAFTLLQFLTSKANAVAFALAGGSSARASVAKNPQVIAAIPYYPLLIEALKNATPRPTDPTWGQVQGSVGTAVNTALQPAGDPKKELTKAAQSVYTLVQRMGFHPEKTGPAPR